jgi:hypothetical protein
MGTEKVKHPVYFRSIDVWERLGDGDIVRYRCFETLPMSKFCVQSKDFYRSPFSEVSAQLDAQFLDLLADSSPCDRSQMYDSLEEAIKAHNDEFDGGR